MWRQPQELKIAEYVTDLDTAGLMRQTVTEVADVTLRTAAEQYTKEALAGHVSAILREVGMKAAGAIVSRMGGVIIKIIWNENKKISKKLDTVVQQPFVSGVRMANEALDHPVDTETQRSFRKDRLDAALYELSRAWGMLEDQRAATLERFVITKLQGLCAYHLPGGLPLAKSRISEAHSILGDVKAVVSKTIDKYRGVPVAFEVLNAAITEFTPIKLPKWLEDYDPTYTRSDQAKFELLMDQYHHLMDMESYLWTLYLHIDEKIIIEERPERRKAGRQPDD
jgi:hypothetical protein